MYDKMKFRLPPFDQAEVKTGNLKDPDKIVRSSPKRRRIIAGTSWSGRRSIR